MWGLHSEANRVCLTVKYFSLAVYAKLWIAVAMHLNTHPAEKQHCVIGKRTEILQNGCELQRELSACYFYKHISNYLLLRCTVKYLFLWTCDTCTYFLIFFFFIFTFLALHMCSASKDSGSGVSSGCAGSFSFSRTLQVGRSWPSGKPGPLPASSVPVAALRSAAQLPHSCCRAESLHQLRASGWRCCTHNIANSSSWTPGASLLISFSLILQKCSRHIWNWRRLGTI